MEEEAEDDELTPYDRFVDAALADDLTTLAAMLREGHDINQANEAGETAFSYCCAYKKLAAAKYLYENGADINTVDQGNGTPLDWAVCWSAPEFRSWLRSVGGKRNEDHPDWDWPPKGLDKQEW